MFKRRSLSLILLTAVVLMAFGASFAVMANEGEIQLQFKVPENQTLVYETISRLTMNFDEAMGFPMTGQTIEQREVYSLEFGETQADGTTPFVFRVLEMEFEGINLVDVLGEDAPVFLFEYSGYMNAEGGIEQVSIPEFDELYNELGIDINAILQDVVVGYPEEPVAVGDTWHVKQTIPFDLEDLPFFGEFTIDGDVTYTLLATDAEANTATIEGVTKGFVEADARITPDDDPTLPGDMYIYIAIDMEGEGTSVIDIATGQLISLKSSVSQVMEMNLTMPGMPDAGEAVKVPMTAEVEMRLIEWH